ncbi:MAG: DUF4163 domain-containing protein [Syntrophomonadaceae bacterium]|nr:DUF4163 domain-containing protein [Syntrophomonadaceae bacterium]
MMKIKSAIALGLAGCLLFSCTALANPSQVDNLQPINVEAKEVIELKESSVLTPKKFEEKTDLMEVNITIPVVNGLTDITYQEELNNLIASQAEKLKEEITAMALEYAKEAKENNYEIRPFQIYTDYELKTDNDQVLSFIVNNYTYTGGAHGNIEVDYYNIDKKANRAIGLADLFVEGSDYIDRINKEIKKQIEYRSQQEDQYFFEGEWGFQTISENQGFYIKDEDIVICFAKYEIAPGAMGIPEFVINLDGFKDILKKQESSPIIIEGLEIETIVNENNVVMIPLRKAVEQIGFEVNWDAADQSVFLVKEPATAKLRIGDEVYIANHKIPYILEAPPVIINNTTYVPLSFLETVLLYKL